MRVPAHRELEPTAPPKPKRRFGKYLSWILSAMLVLLAGCILMYLLLQQPVSQLEGVVNSVRRWKLASVGLQTVGAVAIVAGWPTVCAWCARKGVVEERDLAGMVAARTKVAGLLGAYLVLVAMGPVELVRLGGLLF
nr:hypothetical protein [Variovorax boronicumulans]